MSEITTYYLEMKNAAQLNGKDQPDKLSVVEVESNQFELNRFLYQLVGTQWQWTDKLALSDDDWKHYAEDKNLRTWVAYSQGAIAGYYELNKQDNGVVEIAYFGLTPQCIGRGFGGYLLTHAINSAWGWEGTERVWVHTCSLDHESALANYTARGFEIYKTETE